MSGVDFINRAIVAGEERGLRALAPLELTILAIAEAEVYCDKNGIDALILRYGIETLPAFASAFAEIGAMKVAPSLSALVKTRVPPEQLLSAANDLITGRVGYRYERIIAYVEARI
ncbi:hypothetical protein [Pseudorhodoferax sp.]|uniref:hypothetical protein n=1 Tax=Pseudorhodoferax sp. TaxID=1993553 RepID=UPI002DD6A60F|nr:hypothetical protein [Pseudorhodoferax sp.]